MRCWFSRQGKLERLFLKLVGRPVLTHFGTEIDRQERLTACSALEIGAIRLFVENLYECTRCCSPCSVDP